MTFLEFLNKECPGDDAHDGYADRATKPLLDRCSLCRAIYESHLKEVDTLKPQLSEARKLISDAREHEHTMGKRYKMGDPELITHARGIIILGDILDKWPVHKSNDQGICAQRGQLPEPIRIYPCMRCGGTDHAIQSCRK